MGLDPIRASAPSMGAPSPVAVAPAGLSVSLPGEDVALPKPGTGNEPDFYENGMPGYVGEEIVVTGHRPPTVSMTSGGKLDVAPSRAQSRGINPLGNAIGSFLVPRTPEEMAIFQQTLPHLTQRRITDQAQETKRLVSDAKEKGTREKTQLVEANKILLKQMDGAQRLEQLKLRARSGAGTRKGGQDLLKAVKMAEQSAQAAEKELLDGTVSLLARYEPGTPEYEIYQKAKAHAANMRREALQLRDAYLNQIGQSNVSSRKREGGKAAPGGGTSSAVERAEALFQ